MAGPERQRIDKWLFYARVAKSRSLAAKLVQSGSVRVNREKVGQAAHLIRAGDVLTIARTRDILVYRILDTGTRRGPAVEARLLYEDMTPKPVVVEKPVAAAFREAGAGRPTKKERRAMDKWRGEP
ncbi:RNA-binding S4 domain-containing protein [Nitratireductor sp. CAU 1489]|uniref:RNA-binding S4 domain-containing protein n=1 Tax=Nitratireductor arenosus TaxID=2682096 RepID=A0A844QBS7_9HYPH|nr:RNA-binding S4 domain-containing protein [Nitratireductor arenosus]MVA96417.1 RNA-binding S4 domain-containing protein [Nitratireductor arenosus]